MNSVFESSKLEKSGVSDIPNVMVQEPPVSQIGEKLTTPKNAQDDRLL